MAFFKKLAGEFIDVIECVDDDRDTLVYRFPTYNREIQMGSTLVVRESQKAAFIYRGKLADVFEPGSYKLATANMPIMTTLQHWTHGFNSPFKSEVYYFNTRQFTDLKWGTQNPVTMRDPEFGVIRARAFGHYTMRIDDVALLMRELSGTSERYTVNDISNQLRGEIVTRFSDFVAESQIPFLDFAANLNEFSDALLPVMSDEFGRYGLKLEKFFVQNVSLPAEVEKLIDERAGMAAIGDNMDKYTKFQVARSMPDAMKSGGGDGGAASAGVGAGIGLALAKGITDSIQGAPAAAPQAASGGHKIMIRCPGCSELAEETARFCANCGHQLIKS